jgi:hypothetical protein
MILGVDVDHLLAENELKVRKRLVGLSLAFEVLMK